MRGPVWDSCRLAELTQCSENVRVRPYTWADSACYTECMCEAAVLAFTRGWRGCDEVVIDAQDAVMWGASGTVG